jgi:hypothetical protein
MKRSRMICLLAFFLALPLAGGCGNVGEDSGSTDNGTSTGSGSNKYDATYDFSFVHTNPPPDADTTVVLSQFFIITDGTVSSSDGTLSGAVQDDDFGTVKFSGPCPINNDSADWEGIMDVLAGPKTGQGSYTCITGGISRTWRAYNGT